MRAPSERHGHTLTFDRSYTSGEYHEERHAIPFGGKGASGPLDDAWALWRLPTDTTWSWQKLGAGLEPRCGRS